VARPNRGQTGHSPDQGDVGLEASLVMTAAHATHSNGRRLRILVIDIGGTHVKLELSMPRLRRAFGSGSKMTATQMVAKIKELTSGWTYQVISIGYPGPVAGNRPITEPHNLGSGWAGFDFAKVFRRPVKVVNDAVMQALGSYHGGRMLFLGLGTGLGTAMIIDGVVEWNSPTCATKRAKPLRIT